MRNIKLVWEWDLITNGNSDTTKLGIDVLLCHLQKLQVNVRGDTTTKRNFLQLISSRRFNPRQLFLCMRIQI